MPVEVSYAHHDDHVLVTPSGDPTIDEFLDMLRRIGADSVTWKRDAVIVDLRGVSPTYSFTEQLRIGEAVGRNLGHFRRNAAVVQPERITRVGEKAANHTGATVRVF